MSVLVQLSWFITCCMWKAVKSCASRSEHVWLMVLKWLIFDWLSVSTLTDPWWFVTYQWHWSRSVRLWISCGRSSVGHLGMPYIGVPEVFKWKTRSENRQFFSRAKLFPTSLHTLLILEVFSNSFSLVRYGPWRLCYWGGQEVKNGSTPSLPPSPSGVEWWYR
jgi:hypothetical protein